MTALYALPKTPSTNKVPPLTFVVPAKLPLAAVRRVTPANWLIVPVPAPEVTPSALATSASNV
ncbi:hypothetical protein D3C86_2136540 [compost metagenome]